MHQDTVDPLLAPLSEATPCGDDLEYDAEFLALLDAARPRPEEQYGDHVRAAEEPDWRAVRDLALALFKRTLDLRVAIPLLRADTRLDGFDGFATGIARVRAMLERYWDSVHPLLDASDGNDPTMRISALSALSDANSLLADLRLSIIGNVRTGLTVRQIELGLEKNYSGSREGVPTADGIATALALVGEQDAGLLAKVAALDGNVQAIELIVDEKLGANNALNLKPLRSVTQVLAAAARGALQSEGAAPSATEPRAGTVQPAMIGKAAAPTGVGALNGREDVISLLDQICEWIERHEPTNPAPLLIRRAQRLMTKSFLEIVRDLAPDGLKDVERLAGVGTE